jgi:hypothetical protein
MYGLEGYRMHYVLRLKFQINFDYEVVSSEVHNTLFFLCIAEWDSVCRSYQLFNTFPFAASENWQYGG